MKPVSKYFLLALLIIFLTGCLWYDPIEPHDFECIEKFSVSDLPGTYINPIVEYTTFCSENDPRNNFAWDTLQLVVEFNDDFSGKVQSEDANFSFKWDVVTMEHEYSSCSQHLIIETQTDSISFQLVFNNDPKMTLWIHDSSWAESDCSTGRWYYITRE